MRDSVVEKRQNCLAAVRLSLGATVKKDTVESATREQQVRDLELLAASPQWVRIRERGDLYSPGTFQEILEEQSVESDREYIANHGA